MKSLVPLCLLARLVIGEVPYSEYSLTPRSRTLRPAKVYNVNGTVDRADELLAGQVASTKFVGPSAVTYDFEKNVAGLVSFDVSEAVGSDPAYIGISFTESSLFISSEGCDATAEAGIDAPLWFQVQSGGFYAAEKQYQRGSFRYLNIYHNTTGNVTIPDLTIYFTAVPNYTEAQLAAGIQTGYFHCEDDKINRVWYAGSYTNDLCTIDPTAGDSLVHLGEIPPDANLTEPLTWYSNYTISNGSAVLVDGAKRDRVVYAGDILISQPGIFVSTYNMEMLRESLNSLLVEQNASGALPYAGRPLAGRIGYSFTYHLHTLLDIDQFWTYTGNETYLKTNWPLFKQALNFSLSFIDDSGMAYVTTPGDWLRPGMGAHNIEANSILYRTLNVATSLAEYLNDTSEFVQSWPAIAEGIKTAVNERLWDSEMNLYRDNDDLPLTDLHPQDGNAWAVVSNLTLNKERAVSISRALESRWGPYGAPAPEAGATVSPFASGFELQAHYIAGRSEAAINLIRLMWHDYMLEDPRMTNSTFIEGYSTNGDVHYAPYADDARVSYAHGWSSGPTSSLTFYAAGLQVLSAAGQTWLIEPQLGGLKTVEAGYITNLGQFSSHVTGLANGGLNVTFTTPAGTSGSIRLRYSGALKSLTVTNLDAVSSIKRDVDGQYVLKHQTLTDDFEQTSRIVSVDGLRGGNYTVILEL